MAIPWWTAGGIAAIEDFLSITPKAKVFEWGAGGSTEWLASKGAEVTSVEHDRRWAEKVGTAAKVLLLNVPDPLYVRSICSSVDAYDLVVVDGRRRVDCVIRGAPFVAKGGMLVLDDSQRDRYKPALRYLDAWERTDYPDHERVTAVFRRPFGSQINTRCLPPIFIPVRDRWRCADHLIDWLQRHGMPAHRINLIDCGSTYPVHLLMLETWAKRGLHVIKVSNIGARGMFARGGIIEKMVGRQKPFFVSDPDIYPCWTTRLDVLEHMVRLLSKTQATKIGFSLKIDDIPDHYPQKLRVEEWEKRFWKHPINEDLYNAEVATTFCIVRSLDHCDEAGNAKGLNVRMAPPEVARHTSWYLDPRYLPDDERYYYEAAPIRPPGAPVPGVTWRP